MTTTTVADNFRAAIEQAGLTPPESIIADGRLHRFPTNGHGDDSGWYVLHDDDCPAGVYGCWRSGVNETWSARSTSTMTPVERAAHRQRMETLQRARQADEQRRHADAAQRARRIWDAAPPAPVDHPYLLKKRVQSHGLRVSGDRVLVPMRDADGALHSLQFIAADGAKKFLSSGRVTGCFDLIGEVGDVLCVAEGIATAASIHEATGLPVAAAFSAGNLLPVAQALRTAYPQAEILMCGDNDASGVGQKAAREAAMAIGAGVAIPSEEGRDWNDVHVQHGLDAVRQAIEAAHERKESSAMATAAIENDLAATLTDEWPVLDTAALHGLAGDVVRLLAPHTEADQLALLVSFLAESGAMLNRGPHLILDGSFHPLLFWPVLVGQSSKSRKGTAGKRIETLMQLAEPTWTRGECKGTLSSGEGLAFAVRDPQDKEEPLKERGRPTGETVTVRVDPGVEDKRLFLVQAEFGSVLKIMAREGNSLSGVLRDAWDGLTLAPMTKANRVKATDPHIAIVGHVRKDELLRNLTDTETVNGFGNRFCWFVVRRSKELPFHSAPSQTNLSILSDKIGKTLRLARECGPLILTESTRHAWREIYSDLSADRPGMAGALLGRSEAQVMRVSALYAVLDGQSAIDLPHLKAGLAVWQHAEASTRLIFGDSLGDPIADTILRALRASGELSDSQISDLFGHHLAASRLERSKTVLLTAGLAHCTTVETGGRPRIIWRLGAKKAKEAN